MPAHVSPLSCVRQFSKIDKYGKWCLGHFGLRWRISSSSRDATANGGLKPGHGFKADADIPHVTLRCSKPSDLRDAGSVADHQRFNLFTLDDTGNIENHRETSKKILKYPDKALKANSLWHASGPCNFAGVC